MNAIAHTAEQLLIKARVKIQVAHPFYGSLLMRLKIVETMDRPTAATDGTHLFYNPEWIRSITGPHREFVCAHEVLHCALGHHVRLADRDKDLWNQACDYVINPVLIKSGLTMPEGGLYRKDLVGMSAELAYSILLAEQANDKDEDGSDGENEENTSGSDQGAPGEAQSQPNANPQQDDSDADGSESGGTGSDGSRQESQTGNDYGQCGEILPAPVASAEDIAEEENDWKQAVANAASMAKAAGDLPGHVSDLVDARLAPRINWRDILRGFMTARSNEDYTWSRPNKRYVSGGLYLPSVHSEAIPPVALLIDASYSMDRTALAECVDEYQQLIDEICPEYVDLFIHTTDCWDPVRVERGELIVDLLPRMPGGGTRFAPACNKLNDASEQYACAVWFTDMATGDWGECDEPACPVLFLDYDDNRYGHADHATFGECVGMGDLV